MANLQYYDIIQKPLVTEQSMNFMADKKYAFYVHPKSTKNQIKEAVEKMFDGVKVDYVNTLNLKGKKMRRGRIWGTRPKRKKAIVQLKPESKEIDVFQGI